MTTGTNERAERLAAQLRANLKRRKEQARGVAGEPGDREQGQGAPAEPLDP